MLSAKQIAAQAVAARAEARAGEIRKKNAKNTEAPATGFNAAAANKEIRALSTSKKQTGPLPAVGAKRKNRVEDIELDGSDAEEPQPVAKAGKKNVAKAAPAKVAKAADKPAKPSTAMDVDGDSTGSTNEEEVAAPAPKLERGRKPAKATDAPHASLPAWNRTGLSASPAPKSSFLSPDTLKNANAGKRALSKIDIARMEAQARVAERGERAASVLRAKMAAEEAEATAAKAKGPSSAPAVKRARRSDGDEDDEVRSYVRSTPKSKSAVSSIIMGVGAVGAAAAMAGGYLFMRAHQPF